MKKEYNIFDFDSVTMSFRIKKKYSCENQFFTDRTAIDLYSIENYQDLIDDLKNIPGKVTFKLNGPQIGHFGFQTPDLQVRVDGVQICNIAYPDGKFLNKLDENGFEVDITYLRPTVEIVSDLNDSLKLQIMLRK